MNAIDAPPIGVHPNTPRHVYDSWQIDTKERNVKPYQCSKCKKRFTTADGALAHIAAKHPRKAHVQNVPTRYEAHDDSPSFASMVVDGILDRALGNHVDDDILEFINEYEPIDD